MTWDPDLYLRFADQRGRPFEDLLARVDVAPRTIVDLGCGPGQLTPLLLARWPHATILGLDSSAEMIAAASRRDDGPSVSYLRADVEEWAPDAPVDLFVSNAMFQWVPNQLDVIRRLAGHVAPGGAFAIQVPNNFDEPTHVLLRELTARETFAEYTDGLARDRGTDPSVYVELFGELGDALDWSIDVWETTYHHLLTGTDPVFAWISGTGARPALNALPADLRDRFEIEYKAALRAAYPSGRWGTILPFRRVFVVAELLDRS